MMKKYLSIDIDFWNYRSLTEFKKVMEMVKKSGVHVEIVDEHHHLIDDIDKSGAEDVTNIDYHSDIANCKKEDDDELNCGTWAGFVKRRKHFRWYYPRGCRMSSALCHFPVKSYCSPFHFPELAGWEKATHRQINSFPYEVFKSVSRIGIAMSYQWLKTPNALAMIKIVEDTFGSVPKAKDLDWLFCCWNRYEIVENKDCIPESICYTSKK